MKNSTQKTLLILLIIPMMMVKKSYCQYTLQTAENVEIYSENESNGGIYYTLPALGTTVPTGPDYGCLSITTNPMWYYVPTCMELSSLNVDFGFTNPNVSITKNLENVVIWGPFDNINNITLGDLTSSKLMYCDTSHSYNT